MVVDRVPLMIFLLGIGAKGFKKECRRDRYALLSESTRFRIVSLPVVNHNFNNPAHRDTTVLPDASGQSAALHTILFSVYGKFPELPVLLHVPRTFYI